jgi:MarR family transcriptional regulator for hemolysin
MDNRQLNFSHLLYLTAHHWRLAVNRRLKNLGLSQASWVAVAAIARHHQPLSQSELAQELGGERDHCAADQPPGRPRPGGARHHRQR